MIAGNELQVLAEFEPVSSALGLGCVKTNLWAGRAQH
jgi:hypothetical protein